MRKFILVKLFFLWVCSAFSQSHLNFSYVIAAGVFEDDTATYFIAEEYPVFKGHEDEAADSALIDRFAPGSLLLHYQDTNRYRALTSLPQISDDALLDPEGLLELLRNRIGMSKADFAATPHHVKMQLHSIRYPNHQQPYFNHEARYAERSNGMKRFKQEKQVAAIDWRTGKPLSFGTVGGARSLACLHEAVSGLNIPSSDCTGKDLTKALEERNYCDWTIRRIEADYLELNTAETGFDCLDDEEDGVLKISLDCFEAGEGVCGE